MDTELPPVTLGWIQLPSTPTRLHGPGRRHSSREGVGCFVGQDSGQAPMPNTRCSQLISDFIKAHDARGGQILRVRLLDSTPDKQPLFLVVSLPPPLSHSDRPKVKRVPRGRSSPAPPIVVSSMVRSQSLDSYSSVQDVTYSCGYCGYALNLSSAARDTAAIGYAKYGRQIRKGVVAFHVVDETRFTQADELTCAPHFRSGSSWSWGLFRRRSRLLCRKCGGRIGAAYQHDNEGEDSAGLSACGASGSDDDLRSSSGGSGGGASRRRNYLIRIGALQPSSDDPAAVPFSL